MKERRKERRKKKNKIFVLFLFLEKKEIKMVIIQKVQVLSY